jgi:MFS family permease
LIGIFSAVITFLIFYLMTVFTLNWATRSLGYTRNFYLNTQILSVFFFAAGIPLSSYFSDRWGRMTTLLGAAVLILFFGLAFPYLFTAEKQILVICFQILGMFLVGLTYGPLGTALAEIFPVPVRYTGSSLSFNLASILGASLTPYLATRIAQDYGIDSVGYYLSFFAVVSCLALYLGKRMYIASGSGLT